MSVKISYGEFVSLLPLICDQETTLEPVGWTKENPLWGHCAVVSLAAQQIFGGELLRASLAHIPKFAHMRSHYWNRLGAGTELDFTRAQFKGCSLDLPKPDVRTREYVLFDPVTGAPREIMARYKLFMYRLAQKRAAPAAIFSDAVFRRCYDAALDSPCQKMKFGCVITRNSNVVYEGCNSTIEGLRSMCEPRCMRLDIMSRTESMLGACAHAEERGMWTLIRAQIPLGECELYILGVHPQGEAWIKEDAVHTCLRCAVQMHNAQLRAIYVPMPLGWAKITPKDALESAKAYALKEKKI